MKPTLKDRAIVLAAALVLPVILLAGFTGSASASVCMSEADMPAYLGNRFNEVVIHRGMVADRHKMAFYLGPGGSWTVVMTDARGISCIAAAGDRFEQMAPPAEPPGEEH